MNVHGILAIYRFEMARALRTLWQSLVTPVITTSLYFVVFGGALGSQIKQVDGVAYGSFTVPGLIMMSLLTQSISNASIGIYFPKFTGTIFELLSAPISSMEMVLGYVELIYAVQNNIPYGTVKNAAGNFVKGSLESVTAAAASVKSMPSDFRVSITNAPGKDAYPISSFTWLLIPQQSKDPVKGKILGEFLNWMLDSGEKMTASLTYAPLPENVAQSGFLSKVSGFGTSVRLLSPRSDEHAARAQQNAATAIMRNRT